MSVQRYCSNTRLYQSAFSSKFMHILGSKAYSGFQNSSICLVIDKLNYFFIEIKCLAFQVPLVLINLSRHNPIINPKLTKTVITLCIINNKFYINHSLLMNKSKYIIFRNTKIFAYQLLFKFFKLQLATRYILKI